MTDSKQKLVRLFCGCCQGCSKGCVATDSKRVVALAGQPNCGKSSVFSMITGVRQHIANYPGITVEIKKGILRSCDRNIEIVDLPGMYSLTSFSEEERAAGNFLLHHTPDLIVNIVDASNLVRQLYLTLQLMETGLPVLVDLNMSDIAESRGIAINEDSLGKILGLPVVSTIASKNKGKKKLTESIMIASESSLPKKRFNVNYGELEPFIAEIERNLNSMDISLNVQSRWMVLKLLEEDAAIWDIIREQPGHEEMLQKASEIIDSFTKNQGTAPSQYISLKRHEAASLIASRSAVASKKTEKTWSDYIDSIAMHPVAGLFVLAGVMFALYDLSIVQGYRLTGVTWPFLAQIRSAIANLLPAPGLVEDPFVRSIVLYVVDGILAVLNYIPIFVILFALIAILENAGYMPRMSFILDRLFRRFGLHGQSVLPLVLGGVFVGGCAIPGVLATRGIPDKRARLATIMVVPLMNCLAKVPLYTLLVGIYFVGNGSLAMFFIATITILVALCVSKVLSLTVLKHEPSAPFLMEMPPYHFPPLRGVVQRTFARIWIFLRKIITIVMLAAIVVFFLTNYPSLTEKSEQKYTIEMGKTLNAFNKTIAGSPYAQVFANDENITAFLAYWERYREQRMTAGNSKDRRDSLDARFKAENNVYFTILTSRSDKNAVAVSRAFKNLARSRMRIRYDRVEERVQGSYLGSAGKWLESITRYAGFNWRVNVALLSSFAAKESVVATLGSLYQPETEGERLEKRMARMETGFTPLHALALMIFMAMYPPCIPTILVTYTESGRLLWMLITLFYPIVLGFAFASLIFTGGSALGLTGVQAMVSFYLLVLGTTLLLSRIKQPAETEERDTGREVK